MVKLPLFILGLALSAQASGKTEDAEKKLRKETREAVEATKSYAASKRDEYRSKFQKELAEVDHEILELREKLKSEGSDARERIESDLESLEAKRDDVKQSLNKLSDQTGKAWEEVKVGVEQAFSALRKSLDRAGRQFKKQPDKPEKR